MYIVKIKNYLLWFISLLGMFAGLYIALDHTVYLFSNHNYFFSPFADDILDNAVFSYPIALHKLSFRHIIDPFNEHRVALERIGEIFDFLYTGGVQVLQPYRLTILLWLNIILFNFFIVLPNRSMHKAIKCALIGVSCVCTFANISINNYVSTMQITWPIICLLSLLIFILTEKYCSIKKQSFIKQISLILLITLLINIVLYTFNIGLLLWPIVFILLKKRNCLKPFLFAWFSAAILTYYKFAYNSWFMSIVKKLTLPSNDHGTIFSRLLEIYTYLSRICVVPFFAEAINVNSHLFVLMGTFISAIIFVSLFVLLFKKNLTSSQTILLGYFLFNILAVLTIVSARSHQVISIEWRFLTCVLFSLLCLITACCSWLSTKNIFNYLSILGILFIIYSISVTDKKLAGGTYNLGLYNQIFITEAINVPLDNNFFKSTRIYQTHGILLHHQFINKVQRQFQKGPFSFWAAQMIKHNIHDYNYSVLLDKPQVKLYAICDLRAEHTPVVLINVSVHKLLFKLNDNWEILFTNSLGTIAGFAISAPNEQQSLWKMIARETETQILWRGGVNTDLLLSDRTLIAWAANNKTKEVYQLGQLKLVKTPLLNKREINWDWHDSSRFGLYR